MCELSAELRLLLEEVGGEGESGGESEGEGEGDSEGEGDVEGDEENEDEGDGESGGEGDGESDGDSENDGENDDHDLAEAVIWLLDKGEVLFKSPWAASCMVFDVGGGIAAKVTGKQYIEVEYLTLPYLAEHLPSLPVPRLHGMIRVGYTAIQFTSLAAGHNLEKQWPRLNDADKRSISAQLDKLLCQLRTLKLPPGTPLGALCGMGCRDGRRGTRVSSEPILDVEKFEDFIFAGSKFASAMYIRLLRDLLSTGAPAEVVFTHGDIRPANVMVEQNEKGEWKVVAIIDWEGSGFYPEYWECVKMTNNLMPSDRDDWYHYVPESLSPQRYPVHWLVDRVWDPSLSNS